MGVRALSCPKDEIQYKVNNVDVSYLDVNGNCVVKIGTANFSKKRDYYYSASSSGLFYLWDLPIKSDPNIQDNYKHALAFLPIKVSPNPYPIPFLSEEQLYLQLTNGESIIINTETGKVDWSESKSQGLTSLDVIETNPSSLESTMLKINYYEPEKIVIDFGASATTDPFLIPNAIATLYKFRLHGSLPRTCKTKSSNFRKSINSFEADFSDKIMENVLRECAQQDSWR